MLAIVRNLIFQLLKAAMSKTSAEKLSKTPAGRKYALAIMIFIAATLLCAITPTISVFVYKTAPLVLLTGSEWVTVISMLGAFYFSANVAQKKIAPNLHKKEADEPTETIEKTKETEDKSE
jgi:hypothetical protein